MDSIRRLSPRQSGSTLLPQDEIQMPWYQMAFWTVQDDVYDHIEKICDVSDSGADKERVLPARLG